MGRLRKAAYPFFINSIFCSVKAVNTVLTELTLFTPYFPNKTTLVAGNYRMY